MATEQTQPIIKGEGEDVGDEVNRSTSDSTAFMETCGSESCLSLLSSFSFFFSIWSIFSHSIYSTYSLFFSNSVFSSLSYLVSILSLSFSFIYYSLLFFIIYIIYGASKNHFNPPPTPVIVRDKCHTPPHNDRIK
jgi:hypothetical protein